MHVNADVGCADCTMAFRGSCAPCDWRGTVRLTASEAAEDCMRHNRRMRHRPASATYASLALTHTHIGNTPPIQGEHTNA